MNIAVKNQRGVVIVENLIAILIFSVGILGIVGLLAASMKNAAGAKYRNEAGLLANQIIGQMWTDEKTNTALKDNFESPNGDKFVAWKTSVANTLPGAAANPPTIAIDADNKATVTVRWQAPGEPAPHNYVVVAQING